jgi:hypothetical protein
MSCNGEKLSYIYENDKTNCTKARTRAHMQIMFIIVHQYPINIYPIKIVQSWKICFSHCKAQKYLDVLS